MATGYGEFARGLRQGSLNPQQWNVYLMQQNQIRTAYKQAFSELHAAAQKEGLNITPPELRNDISQAEAQEKLKAYAEQVNKSLSYFDVDVQLNTIFKNAAASGLNVPKPTSYGKTVKDEATAKVIVDNYIKKVSQVALQKNLTDAIENIRAQAVQQGVMLPRIPQNAFVGLTEARAQNLINSYLKSANNQIAVKNYNDAVNSISAQARAQGVTVAAPAATGITSANVQTMINQYAARVNYALLQKSVSDTVDSIYAQAKGYGVEVPKPSLTGVNQANAQTFVDNYLNKVNDALANQPVNVGSTSGLKSADTEIIRVGPGGIKPDGKAHGTGLVPVKTGETTLSKPEYIVHDDIGRQVTISESQLQQMQKAQQNKTWRENYTVVPEEVANSQANWWINSQGLYEWVPVTEADKKKLAERNAYYSRFGQKPKTTLTCGASPSAEYAKEWYSTGGNRTQAKVGSGDIKLAAMKAGSSINASASARTGTAQQAKAISVKSIALANPDKLFDKYGKEIQRVEYKKDAGTSTGSVKVFTANLTAAEKIKLSAEYQNRLVTGKTGKSQSTYENKNLVEARKVAAEAIKEAEAVRNAYKAVVALNGKIIDPVQMKGGIAGTGESKVTVQKREVIKNKKGEIIDIKVLAKSGTAKEYAQALKIAKANAAIPLTSVASASDRKAILEARKYLLERASTTEQIKLQEKFAKADGIKTSDYERFISAPIGKAGNVNKSALTSLGLTSGMLSKDPKTGQVALVAEQAFFNDVQDFKTVNQIATDAAVARAIEEARRVNPKGSAEYFAGVANVARRSQMSTKEILKEDWNRYEKSIAKAVSSILPDLDKIAKVRDAHLAGIKVTVTSPKGETRKYTALDTQRRYQKAVKENVVTAGLLKFTEDEYTRLRTKPLTYAAETGLIAAGGAAFGAGTAGLKAVVNPRLTKVAGKTVGKHGVDAALTVVPAVVGVASVHQYLKSDDYKALSDIEKETAKVQMVAGGFRTLKDFAVAAPGFKAGSKAMEGAISKVKAKKTSPSTVKIDKPSGLENALPSEFDITNVARYAPKVQPKTITQKVTALKQQVAKLEVKGKASDKPKIRQLKQQINAFEKQKENRNALASMKMKNRADIKAVAEVQAFDSELANLRRMKAFADEYSGSALRARPTESDLSKALDTFTPSEIARIDGIKTGFSGLKPKAKPVTTSRIESLKAVKSLAESTGKASSKKVTQAKAGIKEAFTPKYKPSVKTVGKARNPNFAIAETARERVKLRAQARRIEEGLEKARIKGDVTREALYSVKAAKFRLAYGISTKKALKVGTGKTGKNIVEKTLGQKRSEYEAYKEAHKKLKKRRKSTQDFEFLTDVTDVVKYARAFENSPAGRAKTIKAIHSEMKRALKNAKKDKEYAAKPKDITDVAGYRRAKKTGAEKLTTKDLALHKARNAKKYSVNSRSGKSWDSFKDQVAKHNKDVSEKVARTKERAEKLKKINEDLGDNIKKPYIVEDPMKNPVYRDWEAARKKLSQIKEINRQLKESPAGKALEEAKFNEQVELYRAISAKIEAKRAFRESPEGKKLEDALFDEFVETQKLIGAKMEARREKMSTPEWKAKEEAEFNKNLEKLRKIAQKIEERRAFRESPAGKKLEEIEFDKWVEKQKAYSKRKELERAAKQSPYGKVKEEIEFDKWIESQKKYGAKKEAQRKAKQLQKGLNDKEMLAEIEAIHRKVGDIEQKKLSAEYKTRLNTYATRKRTEVLKAKREASESLNGKAKLEQYEKARANALMKRAVTRKEIAYMKRAEIESERLLRKFNTLERGTASQRQEILQSTQARREIKNISFDLEAIAKEVEKAGLKRDDKFLAAKKKTQQSFGNIRKNYTSGSSAETSSGGLKLLQKTETVAKQLEIQKPKRTKAKVKVAKAEQKTKTVQKTKVISKRVKPERSYFGGRYLPVSTVDGYEYTRYPATTPSTITGIRSIKQVEQVINSIGTVLKTSPETLVKPKVTTLKTSPKTPVKPTVREITRTYNTTVPSIKPRTVTQEKVKNELNVPVIPRTKVKSSTMTAIKVDPVIKNIIKEVTVVTGITKIPPVYKVRVPPPQKGVITAGKKPQKQTIKAKDPKGIARYVRKIQNQFGNLETMFGSSTARPMKKAVKKSVKQSPAKTVKKTVKKATRKA
jgi:hypothetical protein